MSNSRQFPNLPQATWTCWQTHLPAVLQSHDCSAVNFPGGNNGTLTFNHSGYPGGEFEIGYNYDPSAQVLTLTLEGDPWDTPPASLVFGLLQHQIYTCPPAQ